jgi:hypothetical protein
MKKEKLVTVTLRIPPEMNLQLDVYCIEHGAVTKSQFIRAAIKERLDRVSSPTFVEPKIQIPVQQRPGRASYADKVAARRNDEFQMQLKKEQIEDQRRQQGSQQEINMADEQTQDWLSKNLQK